MKSKKSTSEKATKKAPVAEAKPAAKPAAKPVAKPVAKPAAKAEAPAKAAPKARARKVEQPKLAALEKEPVSAEKRYLMIQEAAYFIAEKKGFQGDNVANWIEAEAQIDAQLK